MIIDEYTTLLTERVTGCCGKPYWRGLRCSGCGHRQAIGGVSPVSSRRLAMRNPLYPVFELRGRRQARKAGARRG